MGRLSAMPLKQPPDLLTTQQAAKLLGLSVTSIQKMVISGELDAWVTSGGHRRIHRASVERLNQTRGALPATPHRAPVDRMRVLLAEDDPVQVKFFQTLIAKCAYPIDLTVASDASIALMQLERQRPDLILTDLMMQPFDGFHLIRMLEKEPAYYPIDVIVVSSMDRAEAQTLGDLPAWVTFYQKPVNPERMIGYLDSMQIRVIKKHLAAISAG